MFICFNSEDLKATLFFVARAVLLILLMRPQFSFIIITVVYVMLNIVASCRLRWYKDAQSHVTPWFVLAYVNSQQK